MDKDTNFKALSGLWESVWFTVLPAASTIVSVAEAGKPTGHFCAAVTALM